MNEIQRRLVDKVIAHLASGKYRPVMTAIQSYDPDSSWTMLLQRLGGVESTRIAGFGKGDLQQLERDGYLALEESRAGFEVHLTPAAYLNYKTRPPQEKVIALPGTSDTTSVQPGTDKWLAGIYELSKTLERELLNNYADSRSTSRFANRNALIASLGGAVLILIGGGLVLMDHTTGAALASVSGVISEFLAVAFFRRSRESTARQDTFHREILERQQLAEAIKLIQQIESQDERNRMKELLVMRIIGAVKDGAQQSVPRGINAKRGRP